MGLRGTHGETRARVGVLVAVVFWGISFVATKAVVAEISPLIFARAGLGSLLLFGFLTARREAPPPRDAWGALALMGFVGVALHGMLQANALTFDERGEERMAHRVDRLSGPPCSRPSFSGSGSEAGKAPGLRWASSGRSSWSRGDGWARRCSGCPPPGGDLLFIGIGASGLGYLFWYGALEKIEASRVAAFLYLEPLVTLAAAVILLGEEVTWEAVAGGLLLLAAVAVVQRAPSAGRRESPKEKPATGSSL